MVKKLLHHIPLRTLKRWLKWGRYARKFIPDAGLRVFFSTALVTAAVLMLAVWGAVALNRALEQKILRTLIENFPSVPIPDAFRAEGELPQNQIPEENLIAVSFHDLFSGVGWIDQEKTTMYQDRHVTALTFPPRFEWQPANSIGPISPIGQIGIIGEVKKVGDLYKGLVARADGTPIFTEENTPIVSKYPGTLGFGGDPSDFLVVYGAYEGLAFRVRGDGQSSIITDHSNLFGIRVMNGGFSPRITRVPVISHQSSVISYFWYVWSATERNPKLVKLFENRAGDIIGAADFSPSLFDPGVISASFALSEPFGRTSPIRLISHITEESGGGNYWSFTDLGFDNSVSREVVSVNLSIAPAAVRRASIAEIEPVEASGSAQFFLSNDGVLWVPAGIGEEVIFPNERGTQLLWKAIFTPEASSDAPSPFLSRIKLDYKIKFL